MLEYSVDRYMTNCEHCGKVSIHQARFIEFCRTEKHTYRCGWCGEITESEYCHAHPTIVGLFLKADKTPCYVGELGWGNIQYPQPPSNPR